MRSMIILAVVLVAFGSLAEAGPLKDAEVPAANDEATIEVAKLDSKEKEEENKVPVAEPDFKDEIIDHKEEETKDKDHAREDNREDRGPTEIEDLYELPEEFIAIVAIYVDPETRKPQAIAEQVPRRLASKMLLF